MKKPANAVFTGFFGGEGGIRTLDRVLADTRVPVMWRIAKKANSYGFFRLFKKPTVLTLYSLSPF